MNCIKSKDDQIISEYESFKIIFMKELRNLRFDLDEANKQKNLLRNVLVEFRSYFNNVISNQKFE
jgi:hypothetical protein